MLSPDDILRTETFSDADTVSQRVFYMLTDGTGADEPERREPCRTARLLSDLIEKLNEKGVIGDAELDEMLLDFARNQ